MKLKMVCLKSFKTAFMRQINKGVRIACSRADICMNSKAKFHQPSIARVSSNLGNLQMRSRQGYILKVVAGGPGAEGQEQGRQEQRVQGSRGRGGST